MLESAYPFIDSELPFACANRVRSADHLTILRLTGRLPLCRIPAIHIGKSRLNQDFDRLDVEPVYDLVLSLLILLRRYGVRGHDDQESV